MITKESSRFHGFTSYNVVMPKRVSRRNQPPGSPLTKMHGYMITPELGARLKKYANDNLYTISECAAAAFEEFLKARE